MTEELSQHKDTTIPHTCECHVVIRNAKSLAGIAE